MLTKDAETHFGGRAGIWRALDGKRTIQAVCKWGDVVPRAAATHLALKAEGQIKVDESLYNELGQIIRQQPKAAA